MFRAIDATNSIAIVSIDPVWKDRRGDLRAHCVAIHLQCPECHEPVRFRAGEFVRPHFAHKHKLKCSMGGESPGVLAVRAALYDWLTTKFGDAVEIEKQDHLRSFPKPVDCWVSRARGPLGYVVLARGMKSDMRDQIMDAIRQTRLPTTFVFHIDTLVPAVDDPECIVLSTTHRAFIANSIYSGCYPPMGIGFSCLHFLDPVSHTLTTFRGLGMRHPPQIFRGVRLATPLAEVRVSPKNGEFVHPGEVEALKEWQAQRPARELAAAFRATSRTQKPTQVRAYVDPVATCTLCGQTTRDYWWYDSRDQTCRCRECQRAGRH